MDCFSDLVTGLCSISAFFMLFATAVTTGIGTEFAACLHIWVFGTVILNEFGNPCNLKYSRGDCGGKKHEKSTKRTQTRNQI